VRKQGQPLSKRELDILDLYGFGYSRAEIGKTTHLSVHTVADHLNHARVKLGAKSTAHALRLAIRQGLIEP
jgi:DNA-binding CsgD family transcriptional regulator